MNHKDVKKYLFEENPQLKKEYDSLEQIYQLKSTIIELRKEKGWSQKELAEKIGTQQSAISRLESGIYNPSLTFLSKIAKAFGKKLKINFL